VFLDSGFSSSSWPAQQASRALERSRDVLLRQHTQLMIIAAQGQRGFGRRGFAALAKVVAGGGAALPALLLEVLRLLVQQIDRLAVSRASTGMDRVQYKPPLPGPGAAGLGGAGMLAALSVVMAADGSSEIGAANVAFGAGAVLSGGFGGSATSIVGPMGGSTTGAAGGSGVGD